MTADVKKQCELWNSCLSQAVNFNEEMFQLYELWYDDLVASRYGYPKKIVKTIPYVEEFFLKKGGDYLFQERPPAVFLTHDVDYLYPTFVMWLKNALGRKRFSFACFREDYLASLEEYLKIDKNYIGDLSSHLFVGAPVRPLCWYQFCAHYLIDPVYKLSSGYGHRLHDLIQKYKASIGLHGSFFSLLNSGSFEKEKGILEDWVGDSILFNRQHWLNISNLNELKRLYNAGIRFDSSLGWNGVLGVRGGFLRPYPIYLGEDMVLWEIPMLLMDGVLFDELRLSEKDVVNKAIDILVKVRDVGGCVALNWHERTRVPSYGWGQAYDRILEWCKNQGFLFYSSNNVIERIKKYEGQYLFKTN